MKKLLLKSSVFVLYVILLEVVFPVLVDPFNVFHAEKIKSSVITPNSNYIKVKYIVNHKDRFNGYSFMFGSSRVGYINPDKMPDNKIYNMTYSAGLPSENLANVKTFIKNGIIPSRIYIGVDSFSYTEEQHTDDPTRCPYEYLYNNPLHIHSLYMNPATTIRAIIVMLRGKSSNRGINNYDYYNIGTTIYYGAKSSYN